VHQDDDHLDEYEQRARERLAEFLGLIRIVDRPGGPPGLHDFEAVLADGSVAAIEVTGEVDAQRLDLAASADRHLSSLVLPGSDSFWRVQLAANARVRAIIPSDLLTLLRDLEVHGRRSAHNIGDYSDPFVRRLADVGIESVYADRAKQGSEGVIMVSAGVYGGWGWDGGAISDWLGALFASPQGVNKLSKLRNTNARQQHLAIVLDSFSQAGMGIPLGLTARKERGAADYAIPSLVPPSLLTHLWIIPLVEIWEGLRWSRDGGWEVLPADRGQGPM
jgi:hypothetical protein